MVISDHLKRSLPYHNLFYSLHSVFLIGTIKLPLDPASSQALILFICGRQNKSIMVRRSVSISFFPFALDDTMSNLFSVNISFLLLLFLLGFRRSGSERSKALRRFGLFFPPKTCETTMVLLCCVHIVRKHSSLPIFLLLL